jgi:ribosomal protein S18 acetylase RimI-like enzyme
MKLFLGYLDDEPVASSELFLTGRIAGYSVCTRRACRERGIGSALTWTALDDARRRGIPTVVLESSDRETGMYTRLGCNACCNFAESLRAEVDSLPAGLSSQASGTEWI